MRNSPAASVFLLADTAHAAHGRHGDAVHWVAAGVKHAAGDHSLRDHFQLDAAQTGAHGDLDTAVVAGTPGSEEKAQ